ncbi:MAG: cytochrome ubiquinol oxidase subunit I [Pirellulaceae bacterium]|nr:MAG: cytochrome ubiquinol oxidase subunit I [Pirellulaceae bacterium]
MPCALALLAETVFTDLLAARLQMAFTLGAHIILACLGVGMPLLLLYAEGRFLRTGDELWRILAQRWAKAFAVLFAVGAVSGTVLSFELGLLWPNFMGTFGAVIGLPFTLEGFAFFLEAIFVGIYVYGWDRLSPRVHWLTGFPIALSGLASAWFVVTANAWMNCPRGFTLQDGVVVDADPIAAMLNPATGAQTTHMILAAYMVTGFVVAAYYAWERLRGRDDRYQRRAMALGLALAVLCTPAQIAVGDWAARVVAATQPVKLAAMEGQFPTEAGAPLRIGGWPDQQARRTRYAIEIPGMLSWLAYGDVNAVVRGLNEFPPEDTPPVAVVHWAFQIMVGIGLLLLALSGWVVGALFRNKRLPSSRSFLWAVVASGPLAICAMQAGWVVTEVGRQPWIVQGVMRTAEAVTEVPGIRWMFAASLAIYALLGIGVVVVLRLLARVPLPQMAETANGA